MPRCIDLTNQDFSYWHVLEKDNTKKNSEAYWICQCQCGTIRSVRSTALRNGRSTSCGCKHIIPMNIGDKYGKLTVLELTNQKSKDNQQIIKCQCECGNITYVQKRHLLEGHTKSCGCYNKERTSEVNSKDISNKVFGELIALYPTGETDNRRNKIWHCKCSCGKEINVPCHDLTSGNTKSCGHIKSYCEEIINKFLQTNNIHFEREYKFDDLIDKNYLRFDFAIFNKNNQLCGLIEYNGKQHYDKNNPWYSLELAKHDEQKIEYCKKYNYPLFILNKDTNWENFYKEILQLCQ